MALFACLFAFGLLFGSGHAQLSAKTIDEAIEDASSERMMKRTTDDEIFDGLDMVLSKDQYDSLYGTSQGRDLLAPSITTWPNGEVPYVIDRTIFQDHHVNKIKQGMKQWEDLACLKFREARGSEHNISIFSGNYGCWSHLGMNVGTKQRLSLNAGGCFWRGTVEHELGHALGLVHEHQRPNRDDHIKVMEDNVQRKYKNQLQKYTASLTKHGLGYDYYSVMHYGHFAFTVNKTKPTIYAFNRRQNKHLSHIDHHIGKVLGPSFTDAKLVNIMYKCADHCSNKNSCRGDCYMDKHCRCVCKDRMPALLCQDNRENCKNLEKRLCLTEQWENENFCRKTCGMCAVEGSTLPPKMPNVSCEDYKDSCPYWASIGECEKNEVTMTRFCRKSCNKCS